MQKTIFERSCKNLRKFEKYQKFVEKRKNGRGVRFLSEIHVAVAVSDPFFVIVCVLPVNRGYRGHLFFTSEAVCFCKSLRWRLQKPFCKLCGYSRLKITAKRLFQNASSVKLQQKGTKKQPNVRLFGEFQHLPFTSDAVWFCKSLRWRLQKPFCKLYGYSRLKITVKYLFLNASSFKLQQKGTKKQPNVRLFGEFHFHLFRSHCLKSHVFRATRSGDSADFVLHAFGRPHFSRSGRFCPVFSVSGVGNRSVQFGCRCGNVPYGRANRLRSPQITQTFCVAFSCVFIACCVLSG